ncbi:MAG: hypothetical protein ACYC27_18040 [Armatimonadota bacterium]
MQRKTNMIIFYALVIILCLCVGISYCSDDNQGANSISLDTGTQWTPLLDSNNTTTRSLDGRMIERYTHDSNSEWGYPDNRENCFYVVAPKKPHKNAPLYVVLHSANRTGFDYLGFQFLDRKVVESDNPSDVVTRVPDNFYGLFLNSDNDEWWGWGIARGDTEKYIDTLTPAEKRVLDSIEWVSKHYKIDRNRIYLCGVSMGGSGSLGIGMPHGDIFASICVWVPAGAEHFPYRMGFQPPHIDGASQEKQNVWRKRGMPDPPPVIDIFGQDDVYLQTQDALFDTAAAGRFSLVAGWGSFGHYALISRISEYPQSKAVLEYPWLEIRKNEAYPVFTNAASNQRPPRYDMPENKNYDKAGQINAYFRWKNQKDTPDQFSMRLWINHPKTQEDGVQIPDSATADVTLRRLQHFKVQPNKTYIWKIVRSHKVVKSGKVTSDSSSLLTIPQVSITTIPAEISVKELNQ